MRQRIIHGTEIDFVTPDEIATMIPRPEQFTSVRAPQNARLNAGGNGTVEVYKVPMGMEFELHRVSVNLNSAADPGTGEVVLGAGKFIVYMRSDEFIEYGQPEFGSVVQVPGIQTWGARQGAKLRNGEVFQVRASGLTANAILSVVIEGILKRPAVAPPMA